MTPQELDAIRARDAAAHDCAVCQFSFDFPTHVPPQDCQHCLAPDGHHVYVRGEPSDKDEADRRALLAEVDRLEAALEQQMDAGNAALANNERLQQTVAFLDNERARIRAGVKGLYASAFPPAEMEQGEVGCLPLAVVLRVIDGGEK